MGAGSRGWVPKGGSHRAGERSLLAWLIVALLALAAWEASHRAYPSMVPSLYESLAFLAREGAARVLLHVGLTLARSVAGFALALVLCLILSYVYLCSELAASAIRVLNVCLQSVSVLVWVVVLVMIFGVLSPVPPVLVATAVSLPIILSSTVSSLDSMDPKLVELASMLRAPRTRFFVDFVLPSTMPALIGGARAALGAALRISVVAEAFGSSGGVGYMIASYYNLAEPAGVFAWALVLVLMMIVLDQVLLLRLEGWASRWRPAQ